MLKAMHFTSGRLLGYCLGFFIFLFYFSYAFGNIPQTYSCAGFSHINHKKIGHDTYFSGPLFHTEHNTSETPGVWGATSGVVDLPIQTVYEELLNHYLIKNQKKVKLRVYPQERPGFQDFHLVMVSTPAPDSEQGSKNSHSSTVHNPEIHWEEEWRYILTDGTGAAPRKYLITYEKTSGSSWVPHLCGSMVLTALGRYRTNVDLYEEVVALLSGHSTLETIQNPLGFTLTALRNRITSTGRAN
jgi:hypothetical protein